MNKFEPRIKRLEEIATRAEANRFDPFIVELVSFLDGELLGYQDAASIKTIRQRGESDAALLDRASAEVIRRGAINNGLCVLSQLRTASR